MIPLFRRGSEQSDLSQNVTKSDGFLVTRENMSDVYRRSQWVLGDPRVDEEDRPHLRGVSGLVDSAAILLKHRQRRESDGELRTATKEWQKIGPKYEYVAYPERFPADPSEGTGIGEIGGNSITQLRATDPIALIPFARSLQNSGEYPSEADVWLERAYSMFTSANRPPRAHSGETGMMVDIGVRMLVRAEKVRRGISLDDPQPTT